MKKKLLQLCVERIASIIFLAFTAVNANSQSGLCPPNLDFEFGNFDNWECRTGRVLAADGNSISWSAIGQDPSRHAIITAGTTELDPFGLFPVVCPNGSGYSIKLGNNSGGAEAEGVFYTFLLLT